MTMSDGWSVRNGGPLDSPGLEDGPLLQSLIVFLWTLGLQVGAVFLKVSIFPTVIASSVGSWAG